MISPLSRLAAACLLVVALGACGHTPPGAQDPESAANAFFATLERGDAHGAYDSSAFGFQAAQSFDAFVSNAREIGFIGGQPPRWSSKEVKDNEAKLKGSVLTQQGSPTDIAVTVVRDGTGWKLFALRIGDTRRTASAEGDLFTMVGKGTGFNDVYQQPMPERKLLVSLVHTTIGQFNTAVQGKDFHDFYGAISQRWKDIESGPKGTGVTEKILYNHFQDFMEKAVDLSPCASIEPVFDAPANIDEAGVLEIKGHMDLPKFRVNFFLEYVYELPRWKLFGIDISLTQ